VTCKAFCILWQLECFQPCCHLSYTPNDNVTCSPAATSTTSQADYPVPEQFRFYGVRLLASRATPNLENQNIPLCLTPTPWPVRHERSHSRGQVPWISRPYFTLSVLRLPFSSPPTTRRVTVEVSDPASTRVLYCRTVPYNHFARTPRKTQPVSLRRRVEWSVPSNGRPAFALVRSRGNVFTESLPSNGFLRQNIFLGGLKLFPFMIMFSLWNYFL
jgi:hypothetical protein